MVTYLFGFPMGSFRLHTASAWLLFHGLDISALLVLAGIALSLWRRMVDKGARTVQQFAMDCNANSSRETGTLATRFLLDRHPLILNWAIGHGRSRKC